MSLRECLANASRDGDITDDQSIYVRDLFDAVYIDLSKNMSPEAAEVAAGRQTFDVMKADVAQAKRVKILQMQAFGRLTTDLKTYPGQRPGRALQALVERDSKSRFLDLKYYNDALEKDIFARMDQVLYSLRRTVTGGQRDKALSSQMVKEIFGVDSGNQNAKELALAWKQTADYVRKRANAAGMRISNREDWGLPQVHTALKVRASTKQQWIDDIYPLLDASKMVNEKHGLPFNEQTLRAALSDTYDNIVSEGLNKLKPGSSLRGKSMANRRMDHRWLVFDGPDKWMAYQKKYGNEDVFETMIDHLRRMSRDITQLEVLGPNPAATVDALKAFARKQANETGDTKVGGDLKFFDDMYQRFARGEVTQNEVGAQVMGGVRNVVSSALLGGAPITALSDFNTQRITAQMIGMPQWKLMGRVMKEIHQSPDKAKFAARMGFVSNVWLDVGSQNARFLGETMPMGVTSRIADTVHRASGLTGFTRAGRQAFALEFSGFLADNVKKTFAKLDQNLQETLTRNSISPAEWDIIRSTELTRESGADYLRVLNIGDRADLPRADRQRLAMKAMSMIERETDMAVPVSSLRASTTLVGSSARGSVIGELGRSVSMFKNFPVTILYNNLGRYMKLETKTSSAIMMANYLIGATIAGGLVLNAKQILYGRDPRDMTTRQFALAALLQGGGLGIFGDFLFTNVNRFGRGAGTTAAGPLAGMGTDLVNLTAGNLVELYSGEDTNFGSEALQAAARYTPGSSIWYLRLAGERMIIDNIQKMIDPKARAAFRRREKNLQRRYGQKSWWAPGQSSPARSPNMGAAYGQ